MVKTLLAAITATGLLVPLRHRHPLNIVIEGAMDMAGGMADGGTGEPEPLLASVLGSGCLGGL